MPVYLPAHAGNHNGDFPMPKLTKRQYAARMADLIAKRDMLAIEWDAASERWSLHVADGEKSAANRLGLWCDQLNDAQWDVEQEIKALDSEWRQRNWTTADWQSWDLVQQNVD